MNRKLTELAWAAGFFDGEGCASASSTKTKSGKTHKYLSVQISQNRREPLERFKKATGCVHFVHGPYGERGKLLRLDVSGKAAEILMYRLLPFLSKPKREQLKKVMSEVTHGYPGLL